MRTTREETRTRFERAVELPLLVLALAMVPLLVLPLVLDLSGPLEDAFIAADWFIWAVFAFEYLVRLVLSPRQWIFVRRNVPDLLIVLLRSCGHCESCGRPGRSDCSGWYVWPRSSADPER